MRRKNETMKQGAQQAVSQELSRSLYDHLDAHYAAPAVFVLDPSDGFRLLHANVSCQQFGITLGPGDSSLITCFPAMTEDELERLWCQVTSTGNASRMTHACAGGESQRVRLHFSPMVHEEKRLLTG